MDKRPFYGALAAEAVSFVGTRVSMVAIPWFVLTTTGSATRTGLVAFAEMFPLVTLKALAGPVIDRAGARRVAITADVLSVAVVGAIPLLHAAGMLSFGALLAIVAVAGCLRGPGDAARQALVPSIVRHAEIPMERATGLFEAVNRTSSMLGAAFAGGLVAVVGAADAIAIDAASFGVSAAVMAWATAGLERPEPIASAGYVRDLRAGLRFLRGDAVLVGMVTMVAFTNLIDQAYTVVLVPAWARDGGRGAAAVGLLFAVYAGSSIAGSVLAAAYGERLPRFKLYLAAFLLAGAPRFVVLAAGSPLGVVVAVCVVGGVASGCINPILGAVLYERIPEPMLGRVLALNTALCWSLIPFGGLLGGALIAAGGLAPALAIAGAGYFAATMLPALQPRWREIDRRRTAI
ncbi:MAG: hypothetical protein QOF76_5396 [Solirubrobacteraceae bacterium]|jgi:MFS family permease|nr:hypothetical protein [Solirubrobacteraceae bacterium]